MADYANLRNGADTENIEKITLGNRDDLKKFKRENDICVKRKEELKQFGKNSIYIH